MAHVHSKPTKDFETSPVAPSASEPGLSASFSATNLQHTMSLMVYNHVLVGPPVAICYIKGRKETKAANASSSYLG